MVVAVEIQVLVFGTVTNAVVGAEVALVDIQKTAEMVHPLQIL
jgi:hypothetical protein